MHVLLTHTKFNAGPKSSPVGLAIYHGSTELAIVREEIPEIEANEAIPLHSRLHTLLLSGGKTVKTLARSTGATEGTVRMTLKRMAEMDMAQQHARHRTEDTAEPGKAGAAATDPVCGMEVDPHTAKHRREHGGRTYYFCSARCAD